MKVITWNRSFKGLPNTTDGKDEFDEDEWETHATVLDKMLAWEKKLYDEVKVSFSLCLITCSQMILSISLNILGITIYVSIIYCIDVRILSCTRFGLKMAPVLRGFVSGW